MFANNNKTSYTPITVGSISLNNNSKNMSPKVNYFLPTPPASPTYNKDNLQSVDEKNKSDKDINVIMQNIKENQFSKLNLEIYDYFWYDSVIFVMCIYNKCIPIAIYLNSDVSYENSILTKVDEVPKSLKDECLVYIFDNIDNVLEKYDKGIAIKLNGKIHHYKFNNEVEINADMRHSIVPLLLFDKVISGSADLDNKFEPILNARLNKLTSDIGATKIKYEGIFKSLLDFESLFYNNAKYIVDKIQAIKLKKKQLLDDFSYYSKNNIVVNGTNKSEYDNVNIKLIGYFAYYEKYLSYQLMLNKINMYMDEIELMLKSINEDMMNH